MKLWPAVIFGKGKWIRSDWSPLSRSVSSDRIDLGFEEGKIDLDANPRNHFTIWLTPLHWNQVCQAGACMPLLWICSFLQKSKNKGSEGAHFHFSDTFFILPTLPSFLWSMHCFQGGVTIALGRWIANPYIKNAVWLPLPQSPWVQMSDRALSSVIALV